MFGIKNRQMGRPPKVFGERASYKQVAITPKAHAKLSDMAKKNNKSIIETVNRLLGV